MKRKVSLLLCVFTIALSTFAACGSCSGDEQSGLGGEVDATISDPRIGSIADSVILFGENKNEFPMGVWAPVGNSMFISDEVYADIAAAGYNFAVGEAEFTNQHRSQSLAAAAKSGIGLFFTQSSIISANRPNTLADIKTKEECAQIIKELDTSFANSYNNFLGYVMTDEPNKLGIQQIGNFMQAYNEAFADKGWLGYSNIFPSYADMLNIGYLEWEAYVKDYVKTTQLPYLSIDYYPHSKGSGTVFGLITDMDKAAKIAQEANIPLWATIQTVESPLEQFTITEGIARQANYLNLAMGAKGLTAWLYGIPSHHNLTTAMVNLKGEKTYIYDIVQKANLEIAELSNYMLTLDYQYVAFMDSTFPSYPKFAKPVADFCSAGGYLTGLGGDGYIVTEMRNSYGDIKYFVVNLSEENSCTAELNWNTGNVKYFHLWEDGERTGYRRTGSKLILNLEAGKGILVEPNVKAE